VLVHAGKACRLAACLLTRRDVGRICDRDKVEDVLHFLVLCDEFEWERQKLLRRIGGIEGLDTWLQSVLVGTLYTSAECPSGDTLH